MLATLLAEITPPSGAWPDLPFEAWRETAATLHLMTQIVGKVRLRHTPALNHAWTGTLYVGARGLTTGPMFDSGRVFEIRFDFVDHFLIVEASDGARWSASLRPQPIADFFAEFIAGLESLSLPSKINGAPNELPDPIPFREDRVHAAYDADYAHRFWKALLAIDRVLQNFRAAFIGKSSPVHFFWGSFDLAATRFSGRRAPPHPAVPHLPLAVVRDAYSHEVSSAGFWPGGGGIDYPAFYSYAYPAPEGFSSAPVEPDGAFFSEALQEFILPYDSVRTAPSPEAALMRFLQSTYLAAAECGQWDRAALERGYDPSGQTLV
ncbi:conserved hypothetical protein [Methylocella silvestris BL2]|uniref:Ava_C0101 and related proteins n=1 Tax=Methylocella silvestris (strain DSM 15510 / CIP 108128 / LMG 27833 / NCIMB 13906 / BL2) TaxID=395965 RepID=B8ELW8_METSB|nr:DUF5996 family protein [Methylocella silvestris]ACK50749.1 conserved hypothetical protein [Methylocella silvestris BL2]